LGFCSKSWGALGWSGTLRVDLLYLPLNWMYCARSDRLDLATFQNGKRFVKALNALFQGTQQGYSRRGREDFAKKLGN